ncbi:hypothetical protein COCON_G00082380 [Conger conger]|uniref:Uncharacterized protein n=1 Tax=Conger conger TaxID=82655 RepID=A0A9Q1I221_CONCO|nr:hypothetical protein COCON_G00082380 [Conger conger]
MHRISPRICRKVRENLHLCSPWLPLLSVILLLELVRLASSQAALALLHRQSRRDQTSGGEAAVTTFATVFKWAPLFLMPL